jgi:tRNA A-37 threonylcarbamoyl transferase component Bud32
MAFALGDGSTSETSNGRGTAGDSTTSLDASEKVAVGPVSVASPDDATNPTGEATAPRSEQPNQRETAPGSVGSFGGYELIREVARGGMGVIYEARHADLRRTVALKMILAGRLATEAEAQRFAQEARAAANLDHPGIVPVYEFGRHDDRPYYAMAFVAGPSLAQCLTRGPLPPREAAALLAEVADAVAYAHGRGVIHRDLKPSNILIGPDGRARVADFGLAKVLDLPAEVGLTATGQILGTPGYMPPEQARGETTRVGPQSDVYSLGAVLYEALSGRPPFKAASPWETVRQVLEATPALVRLLNPQVPRDLETICAKCLEKDPTARYGSADELAADLRRFLAGEPIQARRPGPLTKAARGLRKHRRAVRVATVAVLLTAGTIFGLTFGLRAYRSSRLGHILFEARDDEPRRVEVQDAEGRAVIAHVTVPMVEPVALPEGDYVARIAAPGLPDEAVRFLVERGQSLRYTIPAPHRRLWPAFSDPSLFETLVKQIEPIAFEGRRIDLVLTRRVPTQGPGGAGAQKALCEVIRLGGGSGKPVWSWQLELDETDLLPRPAPDLDGDGVRDLVLLSGREPGRPSRLVRVASGASGRPLWSVPEGRALSPPAFADADGDGAMDLIVNTSEVTGYTKPAASPRPPPQPAAGYAKVKGYAAPAPEPTWAHAVEALSGRSGQRLWHTPLDADWLRRQKVDHPERERWGSIEEPPHAPESARVGGKVAVVVVAGTRLVVIDPRTGESIYPPLDLGFRSSFPPAVGDLDGDGSDDLVLYKSPSSANLRAYTLAGPKILWDQTTHGLISHDTSRQGGMWASHEGCPVVADLDGDGRCETIQPILGNVFVADGATGRARWESCHTSRGPGSRERLPVHLADWAVLDHAWQLAGDLDGDGWRDIVGQSSSDTRNQNSDTNAVAPPGIYAISGRDGHVIWLFPTDDPAAFDIGPDANAGWLPIARRDSGMGREGEGASVILDARTGRVVHRWWFVNRFRCADLDGDGEPEAIALGSRRLTQSRSLGLADALQLVAVPLGPANLWARFGDWAPTFDLDGDGQGDLLCTRISSLAVGPVAAISGSDGRLLWDSGRLAPGPPSVLLPPLGDLDGDGAPEVIVRHSDPIPPSPNFPIRPLFTILSGRSGGSLWEGPHLVRGYHHGTQLWGEALRPVSDLNHDGSNDLLLSYTLWNPPDAAVAGREVLQAHLLALSGRDGRILWHEIRERPRLVRGSSTVDPTETLEVEGVTSDGEAAVKITWGAWSWTDEPGNATGPTWRILRGRDGKAVATAAAADSRPTGPDVRLPDQRPGPEFRRVELDGDSRAEWLEESPTGKVVAWRADLSGTNWSADAPAHVGFAPVEVVAAEQGRPATLVRRSIVDSGPPGAARRIVISIWILDGRTGRTLRAGHSRLVGPVYPEWLSPIISGRYILRDRLSVTECRSVTEGD